MRPNIVGLGDLLKFCADDSDLASPALRAPFSDAHHTYASNGWVLVRVARIPEIVAPVPDFVEKGSDYFFEGRVDCEGEWLPVPELGSTPTQPCCSCDGTGMVWLCPECGGSGVVVFVGAAGEWDIDCPCCDGLGEISSSAAPRQLVECRRAECQECGGVGVVEKIKDLNRRIGAVRVRISLLRLIATLPGVELRAPKEFNGGRVFFRFDGGVGLVMGLRESVDNDEGL